jgi:alpha-glucosidase
MPARAVRGPATAWLSFENLTPDAAGSDAVVLKNGRLTAEWRLLAPDLFRLRLTKGSPQKESASWAVAKRDWPGASARVLRSGHRVEIEADRGRLILNLNTGAWTLRDEFGLALFEAVPGGMGFKGPEPHLSLCLQEEEAVFGLGESSGTFNKRGLIREFWNIDVGGHARTVHAGLRNMYVSIPFGISLRHGRAAGLFWDNPTRQCWNVGQAEFDRWKLKASAGELDVYLFLGPTCPAILERYTELTGRMPLPPAWGLGYQQCRYSYESRGRVKQIARTFRQRSIPCDVIYLDIHYMDGYRVFTFGNSFPNPRELMARLAAQKLKVVTIVDPGVKDDPKFPLLRRGQDRRAFVKAPDGQHDYLGVVWPGRVRFPDFLNAAAREWWGQEQRRFQDLGVAGFWNDMNEPADFSAPHKDFPGDCLHQTEMGPKRHAAVHNIYGSQMARASYEGALAGKPDGRAFIVSRAGYAGVQRFAAVWTGDNDSSWEHLADSIQMLLNLGLSGIAFCGADVGGFHGNCTGELLARWTQLGAFTPFFRNHSNIGTIAQEPWAFGPKIEAICRQYIELRYQLLPYLYRLFVEACRNGTPIMRPLFWQYQNDQTAAGVDDQFMLGPELIIAPIVRQGAVARSVYLPAGVWHNFWTSETHRGGGHVLAEAPLATLPIFVRAGAILPMLALKQTADKPAARTVNLHIWPGSTGECHWYEDDGSTLAWTRDQFYEREIRFTQTKTIRRLRFSAGHGRFPTAVKQWRVILRSAPKNLRVRLNREPLEARYSPELALSSFEVPNRPEGFEVTWR